MIVPTDASLVAARLSEMLRLNLLVNFRALWTLEPELDSSDEREGSYMEVFRHYCADAHVFRLQNDALDDHQALSAEEVAAEVKGSHMAELHYLLHVLQSQRRHDDYKTWERRVKTSFDKYLRILFHRPFPPSDAVVNSKILAFERAVGIDTLAPAVQELIKHNLDDMVDGLDNEGVMLRTLEHLMYEVPGLIRQDILSRIRETLRQGTAGFVRALILLGKSNPSSLGPFRVEDLQRYRQLFNEQDVMTRPENLQAERVAFWNSLHARLDGHPAWPVPYRDMWLTLIRSLELKTRLDAVKDPTVVLADICRWPQRRRHQQHFNGPYGSEPML